MITGKDARMEIKKAKDVVDSNASTEDKLKAIMKSVEVVSKVALSIRTSLVRVMDKLGVDKIQGRKPTEDREEKTKKETK